MRKSWLSFLFVAVFLSVACNRPIKGKNGVTYITAIQYNDYILNKQKDIINLFIRYAEAGNNNDLAKAEAIIDTATTTTRQYISDVEGMPAWKEDSVFRDDALALFRFYNNTFDKDYRSIINMQKDGAVTPEEEAKYKEIEEAVTSKEGLLDAKLKRAQQHFAQKNGFWIERTDLQDKVNELKGAK